MDDVERLRAELVENWESMPEETRRLLDSVGRMHDEGHSDQEIAANLEMPERSVRNALTLLGKREHDPDVPFPEHSLEVRSFLENFGRWPEEI